MALYGDAERQEVEKEQKGGHDQIEGAPDDEQLLLINLNMSKKEYMEAFLLQSKMDMEQFVQQHRQVLGPNGMEDRYEFKDMSEVNLVNNGDNIGKDEVELKQKGGAPGIDMNIRNGPAIADEQKEEKKKIEIGAVMVIADQGDYNNMVKDNIMALDNEWKPVIEDFGDESDSGIVGIGGYPKPKPKSKPQESNKKLDEEKGSGKKLMQPRLLLDRKLLAKLLKSRVEVREAILKDIEKYSGLGIKEDEIREFTTGKLCLHQLICPTCCGRLGDELEAEAKAGQSEGPPKSFESKPGVFDVVSLRDASDWRIMVGLHGKTDWTGIEKDMGVYVYETLKVTSTYEDGGSDYTVWGDIEHYNAQGALKRHYSIVWAGPNGWSRMYRQSISLRDMVNRGELEANQLHHSECRLFPSMVINCEEIWLEKKDHGVFCYLLFEFFFFFVCLFL